MQCLNTIIDGPSNCIIVYIRRNKQGFVSSVANSAVGMNKDFGFKIATNPWLSVSYQILNVVDCVRVIRKQTVVLHS